MSQGLPNKKVKKMFLDKDIQEGKQKTLVKDNCICGHSRNRHTWGYADEVEKVEECHACSCRSYAQIHQGDEDGD